jgi:serine/threonine protein kinase
MVELPSYRDVLIDLGLGKVANHVDLQRTMAAKGTPLWMAPEMVRKKAYSRKTDIYAMGIIIWEVFAGTTPYQDKNIEMYELFQFIVQDKGRPDLSRVRDAPGMSDEMFNLMQDCWHHDPDMRPSADEVVKRLEQA